MSSKKKSSKERKREYLKDEYLLKQLGIKVKSIRKGCGITQEKLALDLDIEISQISRLERGVLNTSVSLIGAIAKQLETPIKDFFDFDEEQE